MDLQDIIDTCIGRVRLIGESYTVLGEATDVLFECKAAGVTKADMDLYKSEALDDAAKSDILKRYYGIEEKGQAMGKQSTTFTMVGALAYLFTHPEAKEAQLYHREHMGMGTCSKCEGGSCELPEKPEVVYDDAVRSLS